MSRIALSMDAISAAATQLLSWEQACTKPELNLLLASGDPRHSQLHGKLQLTHQACQMLCSLNDFDRKQVVNELVQICRDPNAPDIARERTRGWRRLLRTRYPFGGYHYLIKFAVVGGSLVIDEIYFDYKLLGARGVGQERNALYEVTKDGSARMTSAVDSNMVMRLQNDWGRKTPQPIHRIETLHAAVNGMQNDLNKAAWLMGTHVDVAYAQDQISSYSLFHNPSDGFYEDLFESGWDKGYLPRRRSYSHNVNHLAAVLRDTQQRGHHTRWVVHSQGAIIFSKAVRLASQIYGGSFACHEVSVHGSGANLVTLRHACQLAGIEVVAVRNNPFDPVANVAGCNGLLGSGLARSLLCVDLVAGNNPLASPHTLPFLGLRTYYHQLKASGNHVRAGVVKGYLVIDEFRNGYGPVGNAAAKVASSRMGQAVAKVVNVAGALGL